MYMKILSPIYDPIPVVGANYKTYTTRKAARAIVLDDLNQVALLKVGNHNYYKLPGGGIEEGEDKIEALHRELAEELGCKAEIIDEVGQITQYLDQKKLVQTSYCYLAKQIGERVTPDFTEEELADGFEIHWVKDINEAITFVENSQTDDYSSQSIVKRDLALLIAACQMIK